MIKGAIILLVGVGLGIFLGAFLDETPTTKERTA